MHLAKSLCTSIQFFRQNCEAETKELLHSREIRDCIRLLKKDPEQAGGKLKEFSQDHDFIRNLYLVDGTYTAAGTDDPKKVRPYMIDRISTGERSAGGIVWDSGYDTGSMMLFGKIVTEAAGEGPAYLFVQIENRHILELFSQFRLQNRQRFSLKGIANGFEVTEQGFFYTYYDNYKDLIHTELSLGDWQLRTWCDKTTIMGPSKELLEKLTLVLICSIAVAILASVWVADRITKPIKNIRETIEHYGVDFSAKVDVLGRDEIASLAEILNQMSEQISGLFNRVKAEESQSRKLELQTLVYQINPHFLYNTLDSVNILARLNQDVKVAEIVTDLPRLFRLGLNHRREIMTVGEERGIEVVSTLGSGTKAIIRILKEIPSRGSQ